MLFNVLGSVHGKNILIYIQQDATLHSLFYLETALHVSGVNTTHHQERKQLYLQHLVFVTPLLLATAIAAGSSNPIRRKGNCSMSVRRIRGRHCHTHTIFVLHFLIPFVIAAIVFIHLLFLHQKGSDNSTRIK